MDTCFVIQPFDKEKFDQRYIDIFAPAIKLAGLEPYRIDRDPAVTIPIEQIEEGIRSAEICFAEITSDNPNVWFELGFAIAINKDVIMVTEKREKFPFDVQHRHIIVYKTSSKSDFENLEKKITEKLKALLNKRITVQNIANPIKESEGLKQHEVAMMIMILENQNTHDQAVSANRLRRHMERAGFTLAASNLAFMELTNRVFITPINEYSEEGDENNAYKLTEFGQDWIIKNQDKIELIKQKKLIFYDDFSGSINWAMNYWGTTDPSKTNRIEDSKMIFEATKEELQHEGGEFGAFLDLNNGIYENQLYDVMCFVKSLKGSTMGFRLWLTDIGDSSIMIPSSPFTPSINGDEIKITFKGTKTNVMRIHLHCNGGEGQILVEYVKVFRI